MMNVRPIRSENDYKSALAALENVFDAPKNTLENDMAEVLVTLIAQYEAEHYSIDAPEQG
jgi:HTH-type transcriptional regulator/antitoxin HigA